MSNSHETQASNTRWVTAHCSNSSKSAQIQLDWARDPELSSQMASPHSQSYHFSLFHPLSQYFLAKGDIAKSQRCPNMAETDKACCCVESKVWIHNASFSWDSILTAKPLSMKEWIYNSSLTVSILDVNKLNRALFFTRSKYPTYTLYHISRPFDQMISAWLSAKNRL